MSGGSYDYAFGRISDLAEQIRPTTALRRAFIKHLLKVAAACHDIEWVDSSDYGPGDEDAAIRACLGKDGPAMQLSEVVEDARRVMKELRAAIEKQGGAE